MRSDIKVSICCITYNHASYIKECIEGFLMQKTDFTFEILIHDDASTDGTELIIREYEAKYPTLIKPLYEIDNQWNIGRRGNKVFNYPRAKGKYIALCEGDDYWTDPYKLQRQVDFLEEYPDFSMCFHNALETWENDSREESLFANIKDKDYSGVEIYKNWIVPTASVVFRKKVVASNRYRQLSTNPKFIFGDIILFLTCSEFGKIRGFPQVMSVYRRHSGGVVFNPSLKRDYKQSLHDLEISKVFFDLGVKDIAYYLVSLRSFRSMLYTYSQKDKCMYLKNKQLLKKTISFRTLCKMPRIFISFLKNKDFFTLN